MDHTAAFADYELNELKQAPRTVEAYVARLGMLEKVVGKPWHRVTSDELREFKRRTDYSSQTVAGIVVALHQAHRWGALEGHWRLNGICDVRVPKVENEGHPPLPNCQVRTLLKGCRKPVEFRLVFLGLYAGLRVSESARIKEADWQDGMLTFKASKTRGKRRVPVHPELDKARFAILCSKPSTPQNLHRACRQMRKRLGLDFTPHTLRSTFATALERSGASWQVTMKLLGHSLGVTGRYAFISDEQLCEATASVSY